MSNRRDFLKTAAFAALGSGMAINHVFAGGNDAPSVSYTHLKRQTDQLLYRVQRYGILMKHEE